MSFTVNSADYSTSAPKCILEVNVNPTDDCRDVKSISYKCITQTDTYTNFIDYEILESLVSNIDIDEDEETWDPTGVASLNLLECIDKIILTLDDDDVYNITLPCTTIWEPALPHDKTSTKQAFVDVFLAGVGLYLSVCDLLYTHNLWEIFPFSWVLPFDNLDGRILTKRAIDYMSYPIVSAGVLTNGITVGISWMIEQFTNSFSPSFFKGDRLKIERLISDVTMASTKYNREWAIRASTVDYSIVERTNSEVMDVLNQIQSRVEQIESKIFSIQQKVELSENTRNKNTIDTGSVFDMIAGIKSRQDDTTTRIHNIEKGQSEHSIRLDETAAMVRSNHESNDRALAKLRSETESLRDHVSKLAHIVEAKVHTYPLEPKVGPSSRLMEW